MDTTTLKRGYFSLLRWREDATRDEAKNVAIILVDAEGEFGGIKSGSIHQISPRLKDQGILDSVIENLNERFAEKDKPNLEYLSELHNSLERSLVVTEPKAVVVTDVDETLDVLYRAYIARKGGGGPQISKGRLINKSVDKLRERGFVVQRGTYIQDFRFDIAVSNGKDTPRSVVEVLSFATSKKDWTATENDAGHFLYAVNKVKLPSFGIIQPPTKISLEQAYKSHKRVRNWFDTERIVIFEPSDFDNGKLPILE